MGIFCRLSKTILSIFLVSIFIYNGFGATYYVSTSGLDSYTLAQAQSPSTPWRNIQKAVNSVTAGDVVIIAGGTYFERISFPSTCQGTSSALITFNSADANTAIIDGGNSGWIWDAIITLDGNNYIKFQNLRLQNGFFFGFYTIGSSNIHFENNYVYNVGASGLYFDNANNIFITGNKIQKANQNSDLNTNSQESISLSNTHSFTVKNNEVWEAGGATGGEGIDAKGRSYNGIIENNYVHDLAYNRGGIYIDSWDSEANNIKIVSNQVERCQHGIMISGEMGGYTHDIEIYNNIIANNRENGFLQHQYGNGKYFNIMVDNNTFYNNATSATNYDGNPSNAGEIWFQNNNIQNTNLFCRNNIIYNKGVNYNFTLKVAMPSVTTVSNNSHYVFKTGTGNTLGINDIQSDPLMISPSTGDFTLQSTSPAINAGTNLTYITTDYSQISRPQGSAHDIGAFETPVVINPATNTLPLISITTPADNSTFSDGSNLLLTADASDADGTVAKVEFYEGTNKLGEALTAPFNIAWNSVSAGTYSITAQVTDNLGGVSSSAPISMTVNLIDRTVSTIAITAPDDSAIIKMPSNIVIEADAFVATGTVKKVEFFLGTVWLGEDLTEPFEFTWIPSSSGTYNFTAKLTDSDGFIISSKRIVVFVERDKPNDLSEVKPRNLFSPNGDGKNDFWEIENIENHPEYQVTIYNRQGTKIYNKMPYVAWDGTINGTQVAVGAYFYVIMENENKIKNGTITLIR